MPADNKTVELHSLEIKIARSENLPVLPQIASAVLRVADDPNASAKSVERIIERDPAITAKILRVASSAYYGQSQVVSVGRAISVLGLGTIKSLVVGVAYQQVLQGKSTSKNFDKMEFWRHSLAVATASRILAKLKLPLKAEELYSAGMMHDVGMLVMDRFCHDELDGNIKDARDGKNALHRIEEQTLGFNHADVGGILAERWGLTPLMRSAITNHHSLNPDDPHFEAVCFISAANTLAYRAGFCNAVPGLEPEFEPVALEKIAIPEQQLDVIVNVMQTEVAKAEEAFQIK